MVEVEANFAENRTR